MRRASIFALLAAAAAAQVSDFAFVHASDTHAPLAESGRTIALIDPAAPFVFADGTAAARREFAVVTGDLTEFGGAAAGRAAWETYLGWWRPTGLRVYHAMGNHDATWDSLAPALREVQGGTNVAFEAHGCKFLVLDSTTPQDPRPEFGGHTLRFVREELARTAEATPLFVFFHHPPYGGEWAGPDAPRRLLRLFDGRALAGLFVGHHHTAWHRVIDGADVFGGASTFTKGASDVGWNIVAVNDRILRVAFHAAKGEGKSRHLLTKPLGLRYRFAPTSESRPATRPESAPTTRPPRLRAKIRRTRFDAAVRSVAVWPGGDGRLYLFGLGDGRLVALDETTLEPKWTVRTGGEIVGGPAFGSLDPNDPSYFLRPKVCVFAASDGFARSVGRDGAVLWSAPLDAPSHATPELFGDVVVCATNAGRLVALDARTGERLWSTQAADYAIESLHAAKGLPSPDDVPNGPLFFGAWDEHVRRFDPDGSWRKGARETWRAKSAGPASKKAAAKYWSPADARIALGIGPGGVRVVDRAYAYTRFDRRTGAEVGHELAVGERGVAAVTASANEEWVVRTDDVVERRNWFNGELQVLGRFEIPTGTAPNPVLPVAPGAGVYVSPRGWAAYMVRNGVSWSERLFEDTFVLGAPAVCEPPWIPVGERDEDVGFGGLATRFVVGALDGSVAVVDLDERN